MTLAVSTGQVLIAVALWLFVLIPGLVTAMKGQWLFLVVGVLAGGLVWLIVAFRLARPGSFWARRFYDETKLRRAQARYGRPD